MQKIRKYFIYVAAVMALMGVLISLATGSSLILQFLSIVLFSGLLGILWFEDKELRSSSKQLQTTDQTYVVLLNSLSEGVLVHDDHFVVKDINENGEKIIGLHKQELVGLEITPEMLNAEKTRVIGQIVYPTIAGSILDRKTKDDVEYLEVYYEKPSPTYMRIGVGKILDESKNVIGHFRIFVDRTAEMLALEGQTDFLSEAAHQMRTPLTQLRWLFETIKGNESSKEQAEEGLQIVTRTLVSVDSILNMVKLEGHGLTLMLEMADIGKAIEDAVASLKITSSVNQVSIQYKQESQIVPFKFDKQKIFEVMVNLIDNGIQYNKPGGSVTVTLSRVPDRPYAQITVSDTGQGISAKELPLLTQKFFRGTNPKGTGKAGFGIGLYLVKKIVESHGGKVTITSKEGVGTEISFTLPLQETLIPA